MTVITKYHGDTVTVHLQLTQIADNASDNMRPQKGRGKFQLTAARRRLGSMRARTMWPLFRFNSQPREGGWA